MKTFFCCMLTALFSVLLPLSARCDTRPTNVCGTVTDPDGRPLQNVSVRTPSSGTVTADSYTHLTLPTIMCLC